MQQFHLQGKDNSSIRLGLFYNDVLVSVMTFGKLRRALGYRQSKWGQFELMRFVSDYNYNVIGGASKLYSHFVKNYNPNTVISYADRR